MAYKLLKRFFDIVFSFLLLILLSPFWLVLSLLIKADSKGRIIYRQKRVGIGSGHFIIFKFRTMKEGTPDIPTDEVQDPDALYTRIGKALRRTSLDEIPQLINILKGDMSFVGPRPALYNQDLLIELRKKSGVDSIRPGVTGLAQVNGRDELAIPAKVAFDARYVEEMSLLLDLKICLLTIKAALSGKGVR
jgi:O-antigen biosynthesis protein WbqP